MKRLLKVFANGELTVYRKGITNSYTLESVKEDVCTVKADIQPLINSSSSHNNLSLKEYGWDISKCLKVYCDRNAKLEEGLYCTVSGRNGEYVIRYAEHWDNGSMLVIERWNGN